MFLILTTFKNMEVITVQLLNKKAMKLLKELEDLHLIKLGEIKGPSSDIKLSELFRGKLSDETAEALHKHVTQSRDEWERI